MTEFIVFTVVLSFIIWLGWRDVNRSIRKLIGREAWYRNYYLAMPSWRFARRVKFFLNGRRCQVCGSPYSLDVHHKSYRFLWLEWLFPFTLEILCRPCHNRRHHLSGGK